MSKFKVGLGSARVVIVGRVQEVAVLAWAEPRFRLSETHGKARCAEWSARLQRALHPA